MWASITICVITTGGTLMIKAIWDKVALDWYCPLCSHPLEVERLEVDNRVLVYRCLCPLDYRQPRDYQYVAPVAEGLQSSENTL
jgi:hypothetical protein